MYLINGKVDASVRDNPQHVGDITFIESLNALSFQNCLGTVEYPGILAGTPQGQSGLHYLVKKKNSRKVFLYFDI